MANFVHRRQFTVEWGHCDPAGIVFNSRFFEFFDWSAWLMFEAALGVRPRELAAAYGIVGIPLVGARARFLKPARFNDVAEIASEVSEFRRSSFECDTASRWMASLPSKAARPGCGLPETPPTPASSRACRSRLR